MMRPRIIRRQLQPQHGHDIGAGEFAGDFALALCLEIGTFFAAAEAAAFLHLDRCARRGQGLQTRMQFTPTPLPAFAGGTDLIHGFGGRILGQTKMILRRSRKSIFCDWSRID